MSGTAGSSPPPVALITGAGGGLGRALVSAFGEGGWRVVAAGRRRPELEEGPALWMAALDVASSAAVHRLVETVVDRWQGVQVLVNNAGVIADGPLWASSEADWDAVQRVNLAGAFRCCRAVLPAMQRQQDGCIVNVGSHTARHGGRGQAAYAAAKAGLVGLSLALAREAGPSNIRVNVVLPGFLRTPMTRPLTAAAWAEIGAANALGRTSTPEEVARFVAFLATLEHVSGQVFALDSRIGRWT